MHFRKRKGEQVWSGISWVLIKDVALTGTGMVLILSQVFSKMPSDILLVTGLALTVPSVAGHASALLSGRTGSVSSSSGESSSPSPPGRRPEGE